MATSRMGCFLRQLARGMAAERLADLADHELVQRLLAGPDEAAFEALVRRHGPMVYRVCWRVLQQAQDCEDAFQATFLLLARKLPTVKKRDSLASWLHGVARRVALDARKQVGRRRRHERQVPLPPGGPPDKTAWEEVRAVLDAELACLPEKHSLPLILCYLQGRSQEEAAKQLGWSTRTLRRRLDEARAALGRRLTRKGIVWSAALSGVLISDCVARAALSSSFIGSTVEAAASVLAGRTTAAIVSAKVAALTEGVVNAMFMSKLKVGAAALLVAAALVSGGLVLAGRSALSFLAVAQEPLASPRTAPGAPPVAPAARPADGPGAQLKPVVVREDAQVNQAAWGADGSVVATVSTTFEAREVKGKDGPEKGYTSNVTVKLWDAKTGALKKSLGEEKETTIRAIALSPDKKHAATAGSHPAPNLAGNFVRILDAETWAVKKELDDIPGVAHLAFSPDGKTLVMGGRNALAKNGSFVKFWDVQEQKMRGGTKFAEEPAEPEELGEWQVQCVAFSADSKLMAAGEWSERSKRARVQLYDVKTGEPKREIDLGDMKVPFIFRVAFTADGKRLLSACGPVKLWDVHTGKELRALDTKGLQTYNVAVSPDGRHMATSGFRKGKDKTVYEILLWDAKTGEVKQSLPAWGNKLMWTSSLHFSPDGQYLAVTGTTDPDVKVKDGLKTSGELRIIPLTR